MKKLVTQIAFTIFLVVPLLSCMSQNSIKYADRLSGCFTKQDIQLLNKLCTNFENHIISKYNTNPEEAYKRFVHEASELTFSLDFFQYPSFYQDTESLMNSAFFKESKIKLSKLTENDPEEEIFITGSPFDEEGINESEKPEQIDLLTYNPEGPYIQCLLKLNKIKPIKKYLQKFNGTTVYPTLSALELKQSMNAKDYNNELIRLFIAINIHYENAYMLVEEEKRNR